MYSVLLLGIGKALQINSVVNQGDAVNGVCACYAVVGFWDMPEIKLELNDYEAVMLLSVEAGIWLFINSMD